MTAVPRLRPPKHTPPLLTLRKLTPHTNDSIYCRDVRGGAFSSGAGRGGAKERVNRLIQKFENSAYIVMEIFVVYYDVLINENISSSHF